MIQSNSVEELLLLETSRRNTDLIADMARQKTEIFDQLVRIFLDNKEPQSRRAAWVVDTVSEKIPELLHPYIAVIIEKLPSFRHDGMKRESLRMLSRADLSMDQMGPLINICFEWLTNPGESVAVKVFAMDILYRASKSEPDLKKELADSIEWRIHEETPGFRSKGAKILKKLYKEISSDR